MLTAEQLDILRSNNELLQMELEDHLLVIRQKEAELENLREYAIQVKALQSKLDMNLSEFDQLHEKIEEEKSEKQKYADRLHILEEELFQNIRQQVKQEQELQELKYVKADRDYMESELKEADKCFEKLQETRSELVKTKSLLELSMLEAEHNKAIVMEQQELILNLKRNKHL